jgi:serine/threonine-protein kinase
MGSGPKTPKTQFEGDSQATSEVMSSAATFIASSTAMSPAPPPSLLSLPKVCATCKNRYPKEFRVCPQDATKLDDALDDDTLIGAVLAGSYQVLRLIGEGGMGRVYEARHLRLTGKRFAIKLLLDEFAHQPELLARFEREAQSAATIDHPNVVEVVDVCRLEDGRPFIVTEFLEGEELGALLDRVGKLPNDMSIRITRQICRALMAAHAKGIVHRDMKPENVFLVGDLASPRVKIIDFGISKQSDASAKLTRTGMVMGTPAYMAPEQARGEHVDHRADVYGVGGILYRCVTGHKPYEGEDGAMVLTQVLTEEPRRPRAVEPSVSGELEMVIERAMARDTTDRLPSMADLEAELAALDSSPVAVDGALPSMLPPTPVNWTQEGHSLNKIASRTQHAMRTQREARGARPALVLITIVGYLWCAALLISGIADAIRFSKATLVRVAGAPVDGAALTLGGKLTANESLLVALGVFAATVTPLLIWVRHLARRVWPNTASSVAFAGRAKTSLAAGIVTYGLCMLALVITEAVAMRQSPGTLQTTWGVPIVAASFAMLLITWWMVARRRM